MSSTWTKIRKHFVAERDHPAPAGGDETRRAAAVPAPLKANVFLREAGSTPLDAVGQQTELIRVRMSQMADRLEDVRSLADDYSYLIDPLNGLISEFPQLQSRLLETEALLVQERETTHALRREVDELASRQANVSNDLSIALAQVRRTEAIIREHETAHEEARLAHREKSALADNLERQLFSEAERARGLAEENQTLRAELQSNDQALVRAERDLAETREQNNILEQDNKRLQKALEDQSDRVANLNVYYSDLEQKVEAGRQTIAGLEARLLAEQAARQKIEGQREAEQAAHRTEMSNLEVRVEGLAARVSATDRVLSHARVQLLEKDEALKAAERALKEAAIERSKFERRFAAAQDEVGRLSMQIEDLQKSRAELADRSEMLVKALAAKEAAVDSANSKAASLADRIDQLTKRFEQERTSLETANRRLIEELQGEKAERSLAQGALEIARESRFKLQKQYAALKQKSRLAAAGDWVQEGSGRDGAGDNLDLQLEPESNVRRFPPSEDGGQAPGVR